MSTGIKCRSTATVNGAARPGVNKHPAVLCQVTDVESCSQHFVQQRFVPDPLSRTCFYTDVDTGADFALAVMIDLSSHVLHWEQGMGWTCLEELVWGDKDHKWVKPGVLQTRGPGQPHSTF